MSFEPTRRATVGRFVAANESEQDSSQSSQAEIEALAQSRMTQARIDLLLQQPYFATALLSLPMRGTSEKAIQQAVVTDGTRIVYRYDLIAALERPQVRFQILHALMHILLQHPSRGVGCDWRRWTTACDIAVDHLLRDLDALGDVRDTSKWEWRGQAAETIYASLGEHAAIGTPISEPRDDGMLPPADDDLTRNAVTDDASTDDEAPGSKEIADRVKARDAFERTMRGDIHPSPLELEHLAQDFKEAAQGKLRSGNIAGNGSCELDASGRAQLNWRAVLQRFMRKPNDRVWSMASPNRKHLWRGLYLSGPRVLEGGRFVVAIDTSGSMSHRDLALVLGEIDAIRRTCASELTVLQFDTTIQKAAEYSTWNDIDLNIGSTKVMRFYGRGGTDLRLPFTWVAEEMAKGSEISALIVCTDGFGPLPKEAPRGLPVLFVLTPHHAAPTFGEQLVLRV